MSRQDWFGDDLWAQHAERMRPKRRPGYVLGVAAAIVVYLFLVVVILALLTAAAVAAWQLVLG